MTNAIEIFTLEREYDGREYAIDIEVDAYEPAIDCDIRSYDPPDEGVLEYRVLKVRYRFDDWDFDDWDNDFWLTIDNVFLNDVFGEANIDDWVWERMAEIAQDAKDLADEIRHSEREY